MNAQRPEKVDELTCPAIGCTRHVAPSRLLCGPCWHQVPAPVQRRVWAAWRDLLDGFPGARDRYREARDDAIASLR